MYECWRNYVQQRYGGKAKLCQMYTDSLIVYTKGDVIYKDIAKYVQTRFDTSGYEIYRSLPKGKNKKSNWINER